MRSPDPALTVHKFGGAALADAAAIRKVTSIVASDATPQKVVVASAMLGVTDDLLQVARQAAAGGQVQARLDGLRERHVTAARSLGIDGGNRTLLEAQIEKTFDELHRMCVQIATAGELTSAMTDAFVAEGDRCAATLLAAALTASGVVAKIVVENYVVRADGQHGHASPGIESTADETVSVLLH